jgi:hypothetical protein
MSDDSDEFETHRTEYLNRQKQIVRDELQQKHVNLLDLVYDRNVIPDRSDDDHIADSTLRNYLCELRFLILHVYDKDRYDNEIIELDSRDWNRIIRRVARERELGSETKRNTCYATRAFVDHSSTPDSTRSAQPAPHHFVVT